MPQVVQRWRPRDSVTPKKARPYYGAAYRTVKNLKKLRN